MNTEELIWNGVKAAREGNQDLARKLLSKAVLEDPASEEAWWWLGLSVENPEQRTYCFKKVLEINPDHAGANAKLYPPKADPFLPGSEPFSPTAAEPGELPEGVKDEPDLWEKPPVQKSKRSTMQQLVIILMIIAVFIVAIGGGSYIFLDSAGFFASDSSTPPPANPTPGTGGPVDSGGALVLPPTWTPTLRPTVASTNTPESSSTPEYTPTQEMITPEIMPSLDDAETVPIVSGSGPLILDPDAMRVFRFEPSNTTQIRSVASMGFKLSGPPADKAPPIKLLIWNQPGESWSIVTPNWGDTIIFPPGSYLDEEGVVYAALWNWDINPVSILNASVAYSIITPEGTIVTFGLNDEGTIHTPNTPTASPTQGNFDG
jgi:hypothetical protein